MLKTYHTPVMARFFVNIKLEILVVIQETSSSFENQKVVGIFLRNEIGIVPMAERGFNLNNLARNLRKQMSQVKEVDFTKFYEISRNTCFLMV